MFSKCLKIVLAFVLCVTAFPATSFAASVSSDDLPEISIVATSDAGVEIPAFYDKNTQKYYLFMFKTDNKQVPVTYVNSDELEVTEEIDFSSNEEFILENTQAGDVTLVFKQSTIPSLSISLNGVSLDDIHNNENYKNEKYAGNSLDIYDTTDGNSLTATDVEIKGRGNSSWGLFDKKSYQIKFDKKVSVLGMSKAKKWVLIPNASDDSLLRNRIAFSLAQQLNMQNSLDCRYVDLWVDGDYRGNYLISEKAEIGTNRVNLQADDGILFEWDEEFYADETWFGNDALGTKFAVKETVNEDPTVVAQTIQNTNASLTEFANYLFKTPIEEITLEKLNYYIDVESFVQYYLINEYLNNCESVISSWFWYKDGTSDVFHVGPVWDFDSCMNFSGEADELNIYVRNIFTALLQAPATREYISNYYTNNIAVFNSLKTLARTEAATIADSANMDFVRWDIANLPGKTGYVNHESWEQAVEATVAWLESRAEQFKLPTISTQMHRLYNPYSGEHLYTADEKEKETLVKIGWRYENIGWTAPVSSNTPVYRLYNKYSGDHHYTTDVKEHDTLVSIGWNDEGVGWYSDDNQRTPLYRQFNPYETVGTHNYTADKTENDFLTQNGWNAEGIGWYGL